MRHVNLSILFWFSCTLGLAQSISASVIASLGGTSTQANGNISFTMGEMTISMLSSSNGSILTQGFQQPSFNMVTGISKEPEDFGSLTLYPNPAANVLRFTLELAYSGQVSFSLITSDGQNMGNVYQANPAPGKSVNQLDISYLSSGKYFLIMRFTNKGGKARFVTKPFLVIK